MDLLKSTIKTSSRISKPEIQQSQIDSEMNSPIIYKQNLKVKGSVQFFK